MENSEKRVLLVEDDRFLRRACEASLRQRGLAVTTAADGEEGLRLARSELPDLILLDAMMPGLSGFEVLRRLKSDPALRAVPVIMVTAKGHERDVLSGLRGGAVDYVVKPFSLKELAARVDLALRKEPPATAS